jgi:hypothetical protein
VDNEPNIDRRVFIGGALGAALGLILIYNLLQRPQRQDDWLEKRPKIKRFKVRCLAREQVENVSTSAESNLGYAFTAREKEQLADELLRSLETEGANRYIFID